MTDESLLSIVNRFRILRDWDIKVDDEPMLYGAVNVDARAKKAHVAPWGSDAEPKDYQIHEILHCAFRSLYVMDRRKVKEYLLAEEQLIQDICGFINDFGGAQ